MRGNGRIMEDNDAVYKTAELPRRAERKTEREAPSTSRANCQEERGGRDDRCRLQDGGSDKENRLNLREGGGGFFGRTDLLRHAIHSDAVRAGDVLFMRVIVPRRKDEDTTGSNGIKERIRRLVVIAETVIGYVDKVAFFLQKNG